MTDGRDNIKPWEPGQSGNPLGRKLGSKNRATLLKKYGQCIAKGVKIDDMELDAEGLTAEDIGAIRVVQKMMGGDLAAFKEYQDTLHGKIAEKAKVSHSFKSMGKVTLGGNGVAAEDGTELNFDIGSEPQDDDDEADEDDDDED